MQSEPDGVDNDRFMTPRQKTRRTGEGILIGIERPETGGLIHLGLRCGVRAIHFTCSRRSIIDMVAPAFASSRYR